MSTITAVTYPVTDVTSSSAHICTGVYVPDASRFYYCYEVWSVDTNSCVKDYCALASNGWTEAELDSVITAGISANTNYRYRAYGRISEGSIYAYGEWVYFYTGTPVVTTKAATSITNTSATINGEIITGDDVNTERGLYWKKGLTGDETKVVDADTGGGTFSTDLTDLEQNTTYYFRAYGDFTTNGTIYGDWLNFTTLFIIHSGGDCSVGVCVNGIADQILSNSMVCCGEVSDDGGDLVTEVGFEYGESEEAMWAVRQIGDDLGTGEFKLPIGVLKPETLYHIRFFATNATGTTYGEWKTATTIAAASYGVYEEETIPTICFYVSEDSGHTWSMKFGPYTANQTNIEITKILVRGSGRKQIKFTTDTKTGISASVLCKLDIKTR